MEVAVSVAGEIVIDGEIDALDINTTAKDVGGNANALVKFFEFLVAFDTGILSASKSQGAAGGGIKMC